MSSARTVIVVGFLGQIFAFARTAAMAYLFGASADVDAYNLALSLPIFLSALVAGWLQASFVGTYIDIGQNQSAQAARVYRSLTVLVTLGLLAAFTAVLLAVRQPITSILVPERLAQTHALTSQALGLAPWILVPAAMCDFLALVLSCHKKFLAAAVAPIVNAAVSTAALLTWPTGGLDALLYSLILGWLVQVAILLASVLRNGLGFSFPAAIRMAEVKALVSLMLPILPATFFSNATNLVMQSAFVRMGEGFVSVYGYAQRLNNALVQVLVIGLSTVLLPHLASMLARSEHKAIGILFDRIIKSVLAIWLLAVVLIVLFGGDTILMLFGRGKFQQEEADLVNRIWIMLAFSAAPFAISTFFAKLFQALRQPGKLGISAFISFCLTAAICQGGIFAGNYLIVAGALGAAQVFVLVYFVFELRRQLALSLPIGRYASFVLFAAALGVVPVAVELALRHFGLAPPSTFSVLVRGTLFVVVFAAIAWQFGLLQRIQVEADA